MAAVLTGGRLFRLEKLVTKLPKIGPLASKALIPALLAAVKMAESQVRQINAQARENHDYLTATMTQFKLDLDQGVRDRLLFRSRR